MKRVISLSIFISLLLIFTKCVQRSIYEQSKNKTISITPIESKVLSCKTIGFLDTSLARISGTIFSKDSVAKIVSIDTLRFASVGIISHERKDTVGTSSDLNGEFNKTLKAGTYDIIILYPGYTGLKIENVTFRLGELKELKVILGQQGQILTEIRLDTTKNNCNSYFDEHLNKTVFTSADKMPEFGNGIKDVLGFFSQNFSYPKEQQDNFQASITISFIVDQDGKLKKIDVENKFFGDRYSPVDLEAIRVFQLMPAWTPGECKNGKVAVKMRIPIRF
jgi:hypothetical protein